MRRALEDQIKTVDPRCWVVLIPVEEVEAWLLADPEAIKKTFNMRKAPKIPKRPETIKGPKEFLGRIVEKGSKSQYMNTIHNKKIAAEQSIDTLDRCPLFGAYSPFLGSICRKAADQWRGNWLTDLF